MQFQVPSGLQEFLETYIRENKTISLPFHTEGNSNHKKIRYQEVETKSLKQHLIYVYYLTDLYYSKKRDPRNFDKKWIKFQYELLIKVIPRKRYGLIKSLVKTLGIFDINESYTITNRKENRNGESKKFCLTEAWVSKKSEYIEVNSKKAEKLPGKIEKKSETRFNDLAGRLDFSHYHYLKTSFPEIKVDPAAYSYIRYALRNKIELKDKQVKTKEGYYITVKDRYYDQDSYNSDLRSLHMIEAKVYNPSISGINNRLSTTFTSLRSDLRPYLKYKGRSLVSLDISSSQVIQLIAKLKRDTEKLSSKLTVKKEVLQAEIQHLTTLCQTGKLYHIVSQKCGESGLVVSKDEAKTMFFSKFMYCQNSTNSKFKKVIQSLFPVIVEAILYYKRKDFKFLSNDLTTQESKMMIDHIVKRVSIEAPDSVMITIHDACLVDADHVDEIYNIMLEEIENFTGVVANIKVEDLEEEYHKPLVEVINNSDIDTDYDFDTITEEIGDFDSDEMTVEDSYISKNMEIEKKIQRLQKTINTPYDPADIFAVIAYEVAVSQLDKIEKELEANT